MLPVPPPAISTAGRRQQAPRPRSVPPAFSPVVAAITFAGQIFAAIVAAMGTTALSSRAGMAPERALAIAGNLAVLCAAGSGFLAAAVVRKVGFWEVLTTGLVFTVATSWILGALLLAPFGLYRPALADIGYLANLFGPNPIGGVAVAAVALWVATFVGGSLGFLLAGSGKLDLEYSWESFVARSHLRLRRRSPTMIMTIISICGVALGVQALTVVLSVMSGFELDLKQKIVGTNAHAVVLKYGNEFEGWEKVADKVRSVRGVTGVTPFILNEVMVASDQNISGALVKGIDAQTVSEVTNLRSVIKEGSLDWLDHPEKIDIPPPSHRIRTLIPVDDDDGGALPNKSGKPMEVPKGKAGELAKDKPKADEKPKAVLTEEDIIGKPNDKDDKDWKDDEKLPGIVIGRELAHSLKLMVGDRLNVISPLGGDLGPTGPVPKSRPFRVAAIFFSGMYEYDAKFAYIALPEAQSFFNQGASVTGLELKTDDIDNTRQITRSVLAALDGYPYRTKDWGEMNKNLFSALRLEKLVMAIILVIIVLVACFNIVSTLIMMVLEKSKEISILKSMGSTDTSVMKVFVIEGLIIGVIGTILGLVLGYFACMFVEVVGIHLDAEVYYIDKLPVKIDALQFGAVAFIAILLSYLATIYPATRASRVAPVDGLRNE
jgi:lipoprotein-releasing system permease protein